MSAYIWNVPQIFDILGDNNTVKRTLARLAPLEIPPTPATISVWRSRKQIAASWMPVFIRALIDRGVDPEVFIIKAPAPDATKADTKADTRTKAPALEDVGL